jgi:hypothetical protein
VKISSILIMALATGALAAQEAPKLDGRIQVFAELYRPNQIVVAQAPGDITDQPSRQTGLGVRFMGEFASYAGWYYELGGMFDASSNFTLNGMVAPGTTVNMSDVKVTDSYWSIGAAYMGKFGDSLTLGAHLEGRGEYLRIQGEFQSTSTGPLQLDQGTTYLRPWLRGSADYTFTGVGRATHPYVGIEGCYALTRTSQTRVPDFTNFDNRTLDSLAPRASAAIYAGIRF